ncbi:MAG TPA: multicopper oxidase domain-containing protein [Acidimicrobiales bacterium]
MAQKQDKNALSVLAAAIAVFALVVAGIAVAVSNSNDSGGGGGGGGGATVQTVDVTLSEFAITPKEITVNPGKVRFNVRNNGALEHNFEIKGVGATPNLKTGETAVLEVDLNAGEFETQCNIAGHAGSGMTGLLHVVEGSTATTGGTTDTTHLSNDQMDSAMEKVINTFLQVNGLAQPQIEMKDWGKENQELKPRIDNGVKVFDLEAKIVDWEIEPGKIVKAWTYNGTVPGPVIRVEPGDKLKINLKNSLEESTSLHPHGCAVPNAMDGFDPVTQPPIRPGETFTYEWTVPAEGTPSVCMYHSHHNAQVQVPNGLVGAMYVGRLPLPEGKKADQEVTMVLNDAGTIGLSLNGRSFPGTTGYVAKKGTSMLVHYYNEGLQIHPMHLHQPHGLVVAKDGVPLPQPFLSDTVSVAPGERWSVLYEFTEPGVWAWHCHILTHAETPQGFKWMVTAVVVQ